MCCSPQELFGFAPHPTGFINAGAVFRNQDGEEFLKRYFPDTAEESTRSEVILAMAKEIHAGRASSTGGIFMDATKVPIGGHPEADPARLQDLPASRASTSPRRRWKWRRAATLGSAGLKIDVDGRTPVDGLFAAGETAGGVHGGNRIGGSALSASLVFGRRAGKKAAVLVKADACRLAGCGGQRHSGIGARLGLAGRHEPRQRAAAIRMCAPPAAYWRTLSLARSGRNERSRKHLPDSSASSVRTRRLCVSTKRRGVPTKCAVRSWKARCRCATSRY